MKHERPFTPGTFGLDADDWYEGEECTEAKCWMGDEDRNPHLRCECSPDEQERPCLGPHGIAAARATEYCLDKYNLLATGDGWFVVIELDWDRTSLKEVRRTEHAQEWHYKIVTRPMRYDTAKRRMDEILAEDERRERTRRRRLMPRIRRLQRGRKQEVAATA